MLYFGHTRPDNGDDQQKSEDCRVERQCHLLIFPESEHGVWLTN